MLNIKIFPYLTYMSRDQFINDIKKWVAIDNEIKKNNENIRILRENKNNITSNICNYMDLNTIQDKRIEISDGYLKCFDKKEYSPLTFQYIEECLNKIIKNDDQVKYIIKYLKDNREIKTSKDLKRNESK
jgi:uncharacterized membrane protein YgaE (UPF0421/DUF939 family)|tara:strand:- start:20772 stop:21161 length:390 start_codon:yes stop_codon:yes gene_type:complete